MHATQDRGSDAVLHGKLSLLRMAVARCHALTIVIFMFIATILALAASSVQAGITPLRQCHRYEGRVFSGRIERLRIRRSTKHSWSAEDPNCDRFFFPANLSSGIDAKVKRRIINALNRHVAPSDEYVQLDALVRINLDADREGGALTIIAVRSVAK